MSMPTIFVSHGAPTLFMSDAPARAFLASLGQQIPRPTASWRYRRTGIPTCRLSRSSAGPTRSTTSTDFPSRSTNCATPRRARRSWRKRWQSSQGPRTIIIAVSTMAPGCRRCWPGPRPTSRSSSCRSSRTLAGAPHRARPKVASLREEGVLVMGSGSAIHNLRALVRGAGPSEPEPWAQAFDDWLADAVEKGDEEGLADYRARAPYAREAHPTDEHFLPLHVAYGAAAPERREGRCIAASRWETSRWPLTPSARGVHAPRRHVPVASLKS